MQPVPRICAHNFKDTPLKGRFFSTFQINVCQKSDFLCLCDELNAEEDLVITAISFLFWGNVYQCKPELVVLKSIKIPKPLLEFILSISR